MFCIAGRLIQKYYHWISVYVVEECPPFAIVGKVVTCGVFGCHNKYIYKVPAKNTIELLTEKITTLITWHAATVINPIECLVLKIIVFHTRISWFAPLTTSQVFLTWFFKKCKVLFNVQELIFKNRRIFTVTVRTNQLFYYIFLLYV